jgi:hypothetical protein
MRSGAKSAMAGLDMDMTGIKALASNSTQIKTLLSNLNVLGAIVFAKSVETAVVFANTDAGKSIDRLNLELDTFGSEHIDTGGLMSRTTLHTMNLVSVCHIPILLMVVSISTLILIV